MKRLRIYAVAGVLAATLTATAQQTPRAMTVEDLAAWERITEKRISDDGRWVAVKTEPWRGDAKVSAYNQKGDEIVSISPAGRGELSASHYLVATGTASLAETEALKLKKTRPKDMPLDKLIIYNLKDRREETIDSVASYKLSEEADFIAYQSGMGRDSALYVRSLDGTQTARFSMVNQYIFTKRNSVVYFVTKDTTALRPGLYAFRPGRDAAPAALFEGEGVFKQLAADEEGGRVAFLYCPDRKATATDFAIYLAEGTKQAVKIADRTASFVPAGWVISENGRVRFTRHSARIFFGIAPEPRQKDTTILAENRPEVHIWNWDEDTQYTVQDYNRAADLKQTYTVTYNIAAGNFVQLTTPETDTFLPAEDDAATRAILTVSKPYATETMWEGAGREDIYLIDLLTGAKTAVKTGLVARVRLSPGGKYAYWYSVRDSSWYTWSVAEGREHRLTKPSTFVAWNEDHDTPSHPQSYGTAGWTAADEAILLYDRYDIWRFSPQSASPPVNLTRNGREKGIAYRYAALDREETWIDTASPRLLTGFNHTTKGYGYYEANLSRSEAPAPLLAGNYLLTTPIKAKKSGTVIYTVENFATYPDIHLSDLTFRRSTQLTHGAGQQDAFVWGTAELVSWTSLDGKTLEGVVYKPAGFDPARKYPLMVNFYERNAETYHSYRMPEPHRSSVDYHFYNSNGYIVFNPDIIYEDGYPGESCYKAVMSGVTALVARGYIDEKAIGAQGHSWGGYQDAYLATHTNLFAAIESGAPVVNMFSAYGGIRWGSGLNRSFQYEHGQSRIGKSIWESPLRYLENSPLFEMDKVQTPILIMANDKDGHVPWYQGIEFFVALKRLQKPVWLLNYTGEPHWPTRMANKIDFQKRMFQFFEHYLHNQPEPVWMTKGISATDRDFELGYEGGIEN
jgi:dipeptidyl aminopeptidase/acylaminoacyl peptidase